MLLLLKLKFKNILKMKKINIDDLILREDRQEIIESTFDKNWLDICIEYPAIFRSAKVLRDFIVDIADFFNFKWTWKSRLTLIADELNNNWIEYWSIETDTNLMTIRTIIEWWEVSLVLEVEDTGNWKDSKTADEMNKKRKEKEEQKKKGELKNSWIRGRWLYLIITKLVDELYFKDSEKWWLIVWIKKKIEIEK